MALPRMRTIAGVFAIIKEQDPDTELTMHYLRQLVASGAVPIISVGRKKLMNADLVIEYIATGYGMDVETVNQQTGEIRQVPV